MFSVRIDGKWLVEPKNNGQKLRQFVTISDILAYLRLHPMENHIFIEKMLPENIEFKDYFVDYPRNLG